MSAPTARRGEVWFADVPGDKRRPVLVMTRDPMGQLLHSVIVAPVSSVARDLATEISLGEDAGLVEPSVANFDHIILLPRTRLIRRLGRADASSMDEACRALAIATG